MKLIIIGGVVILLCIMIASCQNEDQLEFKRYYSSGSLIYQSHCQNCHGVNGEGLGGLIPPLTDRPYLTANKAFLACIVKNGLKGKVIILNKSFEGEMPENNLPSVEIAEVLTYVTNSFGNKQGTFTTQQVNDNLAKCE